MRLQHHPVLVEEIIKRSDRRIGARGPGDFVIAQPANTDGIDLDHAEAQRLIWRLSCRPQRTTQAQAVEQEGAGEFVRHDACLLDLALYSLPLTPASAKLAMPLWQRAAARTSGMASAAPEASPSRMPNS